MLGGEFRVSTAIIISILMASDFWTKSLAVRAGFLLPSSAHAFLRYPSQSTKSSEYAAASPKAKHRDTRAWDVVKVNTWPFDYSQPKHACLRHCLNRKRLHTLWALLRLQVAERTRAREVGKRKPVATASDFVQKSLALRIEIMIAVETQSTPPSTLLSHPAKSGSVFKQPPNRVTRREPEGTRLASQQNPPSGNASGFQ